MIVWSGKGFLSIVVLVGTFILLAIIIPEEQGDYAFIISAFVAAAFSWFMGKKWNQEKGRTMIDKETGEEIEMNPDHSIFWIKMEYWGIIFTVFGVIILIQQFI